MPIFDFQCDRCGLQQEVLVFHGEELPFCKECGGPMTQLPSAPALLKIRESTLHEQWKENSYQPQGRPMVNRPPLPGDMGKDVRVYDMEFGHQERELLARKSELDNM